ncbi:copper resistance CopC family protein [Ornithinimicrobium panacihumi]|uniref:copper resistance CopC family protein n=1 Tax=Ornithinimicrobium panacihumi TaxID=2008449 RepID=UPI003F895F59
MPLLRAVLTVLFSTALLLVGPGALAHDELIEASPEDGQTLETAPEAIELTFSGEIAQVGAQLAVTGGDVAQPLDGAPRVEGLTLVQDLADLGPGTYEVLWRVTSQDGHPISGAFSFTVGGDAGAAPASGEDDETGGAGSTDETGEATTTATSTEPSGTGSTTGSTSDTEGDAAEDGAAGGMPTWVWAVVGLGVVGLIGLLALTWSRGRR